MARGDEPVLGARGTSFRRWRNGFGRERRTASCVEELSFWTGMLSKRVADMLVDGIADAVRDVMGTAGR